MPALVFFPWICVEDLVEVGRFRLIPYQRRGTWPDDVHRLLAAYERAPGHPVEKATIVEVEGALGGELAESDLEHIFDLRRAVSFAGLRYRRYFRHDGYLNDHTFTCVVQNYRPGQEGVGVTARRRDGSSDKLWSSGWRVLCPDHVSAGTKVQVDAGLVAALQTAMVAEDGEGLRDAIELFNLANTDSSDVRPHTELMLSAAAAQGMLGMTKRFNAQELANGFAGALSEIEPERTPADSRRPMTPSRKATTLRAIWFENFYTSRSVVAHGRPDGLPKATWTLAEHLLLSSYIIPRLALVRLAKAGLYSLTERDRFEIADFDHLLCPTTLFGPPDAMEDEPTPDEFHAASGPWAWTETLCAAAGERHRRKHGPELERLVAKLFAASDATEADAPETEDESPDSD